MKISYIILTYNRADSLAYHIGLINSQKILNKDDDIEIVVADDGSGDSTNIMAESFLKCGHIQKYVNTKSYNSATPAKARNLGINAATGDLLIFADDDCLPHPKLIEQYKKTKIGYCSVGYRSSLPESLKKNVDNFDPEKDLEDGRPQLYWQRAKDNNFIWHHFSSGSFAIWKDDLNDVRFDEEFVGYGLEDRHFAWLLDKKGIKFEFLYTAIIYHDHNALNRPRSQKDEELQINKKMYYEKIRE